MTPVDLGPYLDAAKSHRPVRFGRRRRVVLRWDDPDVDRLDALRERYKVPRATVARALVYLGLLMVEGPPPPLPDACEPGGGAP